MNRISTILLVSLGAALAPAASGQFSVSGGGSLIPTSGTGGDNLVAGDTGALYDTVQAGFPGTATVVVPVPVISIQSIEIQGLSHTWIGDTQATLEDPGGVEHLVWLRPGYLNPSNFGYSGDFTGGSYTFVDDGSGSNLPSTSGTLPLPAGTYNQSFASGGTTWVSGTNGIFNTPLGAISGPAGLWTLKIYDWGGGDTGSFSGWTLNGNAVSFPGISYCFGDGSSGVCPCGVLSGLGEGCPNSSGTGATLAGSGIPSVSFDTMVLDVTGAPPNRVGLFFQGPNQILAPAGDGFLCSNASLRYAVNATDAIGSVTQTGFGVNASVGQSINYQYWFRDPFPSPGVPCGGQFNFSGAIRVTWN